MPFVVLAPLVEEGKRQSLPRSLPQNLHHTPCLIHVSLFNQEVMSDFWDPMGYSPPGSSLHRISQARILEWVVISFSMGSSQPRD